MNQCWIDPSKVPHRDGYTRIKNRGPYRDRTGHSVAYQVLVGPLRAGMHLHHECPNKACYNPAHLRWVTPSEHIQEHSPNQYRDRTHCKHGHEFTEENTRRIGNARVCRGCERSRKRRR